MAQLQKMGIARSEVLEKTGRRSGWGWATAQCLFHSKPHFLSAPWCGLSTAKTLEQKQPGRPSSGLFTPAAALTQAFFPLPASVAHEPRKPWQSLQMCSSCLVDALGTALRAVTSVASLLKASQAAFLPCSLPVSMNQHRGCQDVGL